MPGPSHTELIELTKDTRRMFEVWVRKRWGHAAVGRGIAAEIHGDFWVRMCQEDGKGKSRLDPDYKKCFVRGEAGKPSQNWPFIHTCANRLLIDRLNDQAWLRERSLTDAGDPSASSDPIDEAVSEELSVIVRCCVDRLPDPRQREAIKLRWLDGERPYEKIAAVMALTYPGTTVDTVRMLLHHGNKELRSLVERSYPDLAEEMALGGLSHDLQR